MPVHDWTRVDAGIFHAFHHDWITEAARALNRGLLPEEYYALPEQFAGAFGPDVLTLQGSGDDEGSSGPSRPAPPPAEKPGGLLTAPEFEPTAESELGFYRRKQKAVAVRHVSGDRIVAMLEIISPGNKAARNPLRAFVHKAAELVEKGVHLLLIDLFPPGRRDPEGIHGEVWPELACQEYTGPPDKPLTLASYETGDRVRAYVVRFAVGDALTNMPLFLEPGESVSLPLEATYLATFAEVPRRWRRVLEAS